MKYKEHADRIIWLMEEDLKLRDELIIKGKLGKGYDEEMAKLHNRNANELNAIIEQIGYPTLNKVGKEASEAAWLIVQHSIGQPEFMKRCMKLLDTAVKETNADPVNLAYLSDRIAFFEGKLQCFGTSFDWDENGELNPTPYDDRVKVNVRRKGLGLTTLEEQTLLLRKQAETELPPADFYKRRLEYDQWRKKVGWIKE